MVYSKIEMALYAFIGAGGVKIGSVGWVSHIRNREKCTCSAECFGKAFMNGGIGAAA